MVRTGMISLRSQCVLPIYRTSRHAKEASITGPVLAYDHSRILFGEKSDRLGGPDGLATLARPLVNDERDLFACQGTIGVQVPVALGK